MSEPGTPAGGGAAADEVLAAVEATKGQLAERMGIRFVEVHPERLVATMPVEGNRQPYGLLHGGASVVLAESLGSTGALLSAGEGRIAVGIEVNATHHRTATEGTVTGVARRVHLGRTVATYEIVVSDGRGGRVCTCRLTCLLRDRPPGIRHDPRRTCGAGTRREAVSGG